MSDTVLVCRDCGAINSWVRVTDGEEEGVVHGHWECIGCGVASGVWIDAGTLDLTALRADPPDNDNDFVVYP